MAVKPTLVQLTTGNVDPTVLNSNMDILAEAIADCWDKTGTDSGNNTITGDLDMNGFVIKNIGDPDEDADSIATRGWVETNYGSGATAEAEHWANYPENQLVPEGDLVDDYSALHHAAKAAASATAAQLAETNAETAETNAEAAQVAAEAAQVAAELAAGVGRTILEIGDWNMATTASKAVTHGLTYDKIRNVSVLIRSDTDGSRSSLFESGSHQPFTINSTTITLYRKAAGVFTTAAYDSTSYNRGWIIVESIP